MECADAGGEARRQSGCCLALGNRQAPNSCVASCRPSRTGRRPLSEDTTMKRTPQPSLALLVAQIERATLQMLTLARVAQSYLDRHGPLDRR
jgi:hypothetical protein